MLDLVTERSTKAIASITAARGRGKSAALGLAVAGAIGLNFTHIFVTSPSPENLKAFFEFLKKGLEALGLKEHADYDVVQSQKPNRHKCIVAVNVYRNHRQSVRVSFCLIYTLKLLLNTRQLFSTSNQAKRRN